MRIVAPLSRSLLCVVVAVAAVGCSSTSSTSSTPSTSQSDPDGGIHGTIPAGSKFAKIAIGMSEKQVTDLIGEPTDMQAYSTGKHWIPFYFGDDAARTELRYKGDGRITFTGLGVGGSHLSVYRVEYDPTESGYNK